MSDDVLYGKCPKCGETLHQRIATPECPICHGDKTFLHIVTPPVGHVLSKETKSGVLLAIYACPQCESDVEFHFRPQDKNNSFILLSGKELYVGNLRKKQFDRIQLL